MKIRREAACLILITAQSHCQSNEIPSLVSSQKQPTAQSDSEVLATSIFSALCNQCTLSLRDVTYIPTSSPEIGYATLGGSTFTYTYDVSSFPVVHDYLIESSTISDQSCVSLAPANTVFDKDHGNPFLTLTGPDIATQYAAFSSSVISHFSSNIGFSTCDNGASVRIVLDGSNPATPTATTGSTPTGNPILTAHIKILISVIVPFSGIGFLAVSVLLLRRYRRKARILREQKNDTNSLEGLYFQRKGELEDEARSKHELEAVHRMYELQGQDAALQISSGSPRRSLLTHSNRSELMAAEFAQELDARHSRSTSDGHSIVGTRRT